MIGDRCLRVAHHAFILFLVVATAAVLSAQTVVDPRFVEFTPSADHNTNASDGTPLVQRYSLSVYVVGSSVAFDTMDLGKPTPSGGVIRVDFLPLLHTVPTPGVVFEARVTAVGPGGSTASSLSNGFSFQPACAPSINSTGQSVGSGGATGSVGVTAGAGCAWSATSNAGWITLTGADGRDRERIRALQRCGEHEHLGAHRHADRRRADLLGEPGGAVVQLHGVADESSDAGRRRPRLDRRHGASRLRMDGGQQQHRLVDGDEWRERQRQWHGGFQHDRESQRHAAHRFNHDRRTGVHGDAGSGAVQLYVDAAQPFRGIYGRSRFDSRGRADRVRLDWRQQQRMADGDERRERQRQRQRGLQRVRECEFDSSAPEH